VLNTLQLSQDLDPKIVKVARTTMRQLLELDDDETYLDCGEVNCTRLAEEVAETLGLYADDFDATIHPAVFDIAHEVAEDFEHEERC
jgi:hypothetical protein